MVTIHTTRFNIKNFYVLPTHCIYVFRTDYSIHHKPNAFNKQRATFTARYEMDIYV
jgi:hypothetical protein